MATRVSVLSLIRAADPDWDKKKQKDLAYEFSHGHNFYTGAESGAVGYADNPPQSED